MDFHNIIHLLKDLKNLKSISEMISTYLKVVKNIYVSIGHDREHSVFFSILVISLIKSQEIILDKLLFFMENFRRIPLSICECKNEIESICINKNHKDLDEGELTYYLTVLKAALKFIEKIEFYDLQITKEEFDEKMKGK